MNGFAFAPRLARALSTLAGTALLACVMPLHAASAQKPSFIRSSIPADLRAEVSAVVSPAMGGVIAGHEMARALGVEAMFLERPEGVFELRRGFRLTPGAKVLMMEDVVTTGLSSREAIKAIEEAGGRVIAAGCLVDRSNGTADVGVPLKVTAVPATSTLIAVFTSGAAATV